MASRASVAPSAFNLLKRYFQVYWLKPFDAVNDTANAWALRRFSWEEPILEIGGGDGMFSFIMQGGEFAFGDDRYFQCDPGRGGDIFDVYTEGKPLQIRKKAGLTYAVGVDLKVSHLQKARETGLYQEMKSSAPEKIPLGDSRFQTVFLYLFHGLSDYEKTLREARRVIRPRGKLLMVAFNDTVGRYFICHKLKEFFNRKGWRGLARFWDRLDGGRYQEIGGLAKSLPEWEALLEKTGFRLNTTYAQVSPGAWRVYDIQTRPFFRTLIRWTSGLEKIHLRRLVKFIWLYGGLVPLFCFYRAAARPRPVEKGTSCRDVLFVFNAEAA